MKSLLSLFHIACILTLMISTSACAQTTPQSDNEKPTIYYVYDPMCGWCYGFTETVLKLKEKYADQARFKVVAGGLIPIDSIPITNYKEYVLEGKEYFEEETGVSYGKGFTDSTLLDPTVYARSLEPAMAILIIQEIAPDRAVDFLVKIQRAIFYDGIHPMVKEAYLPYLEGFDVSEEVFMEKMNSEEYRDKVIEGYKKSAQAGVTGYPVLLYIDEGTPKFITDGHMDFDRADKKVEKAMKKL